MAKAGGNVPNIKVSTRDHHAEVVDVSLETHQAINDAVQRMKKRHYLQTYCKWMQSWHLNSGREDEQWPYEETGRPPPRIR